MENSVDLELNNLINELVQGKELANQLRMNLNCASPSSDKKSEFLIERIRHSYEKAISMLNYNGDGLADQELINKDQKEPKKRKEMPTSTKKIQLSPGTRIDEQLDDGYSWRKYGQKVILGAKHPRGYYRCSHGRDQGCLAKKKVQRSDNDPTVIDVTYIGGHTCNHVPNTPNPNPTPTPTLLPENGIFPEANNQPFQPFIIDQSTSEINLENYVFLDNTMDDDMLDSMFVSPAMTTWELNYFGGSHNAEASLQSHEMVNPLMITSSSFATTGTNSPVVGFDFPVGSTDFDSKFDLGSR